MSAAKTTIRRLSACRHQLLPHHSTGHISRPHLHLRIIFISLSLLPLFATTLDAALLQGCNFDDSLCLSEETCVPDGLFGQCYSAAEAELLKPLILDAPLNELQSELLRLELTRLANNGYDWPHAQAQCVLAYFKLSIAYQLDYDTEFCSVRNPSNIWELIQRVQGALSSGDDGQEVEMPEAETEADAEQGEMVIPVVLLDDEQEGGGLPPQEELYQVVASGDNNEVVLAEPAPVSDQDESAKGVKDEAILSSYLHQLIADEKDSQQPRDKKADTQQLDDSLMDALSGSDGAAPADLSSLDDEQLFKIAGFIEALQAASEKGLEGASSAPEVAEVIPLTSETNEQQLLLKKDPEVASSADLGLANTVHKIVKGGIQRVEGNRVYLRVEPKANMTEEELYKVISYLDKRIATPNELYFDEFLYENDQLSFRISRAPEEEEEELTGDGAKKGDHLESASGVAKAVYKRRKDIQSLAGVQVDETGIGSGSDVVPVERSDRDMFFMPILAVCVLTVTSLMSVLAVQLYKNRRGNGTFNKSYLPEVIDHIEGKASSVYEELCRHRHANQDAPTSVKVVGSKHSSTSSWPDDSLLQSSHLDISTGHVLLSFLQQFLDKPEDITAQWRSVKDYANADGTTHAGTENSSKNYDAAVLPYDESLVQLQSTADDQSSTYINASAIYDSDPRQVAYIATQSPMENTGADFWQLVWDQGVALIVNLTDQEDLKNGRGVAYWPEEGAKAFGQFEVHLVSEHIWSADYVVRSLYLKNMNTGETRTVTQFHYLTWPEAGCPSSTKSLLEFRRKVNKSWRGRASPILVHCTDGAGRAGTYCLLDMVASRILNGVKELNIAGSLEHLRDQRMGMVANEDQYKMVYASVASEVDSLIRNLAH